MIRYKIKINYTVYTIMALNFLIEHILKKLVHLMNRVSMLFVYLQKSQSIPGAEWDREASLQIAQMLNLKFGKRVSVPF